MNLPLNAWANISINVQNIANECFKPQIFRSIESISITANCKIRRIFSMKNNLVENDFGNSNLSKQIKNNQNSPEELSSDNHDSLPKTLMIPNITLENININFDKIKSLQDSDKLDKNKETGFGNKEQDNTNNVQGMFLLSPNNNNNNRLYYKSGMENFKPGTGIDKTNVGKPRISLLSDSKKSGTRSKSNNPKYLFKRKTNIEGSPKPESKHIDVDTPVLKEQAINHKDFEELYLNSNSSTKNKSSNFNKEQPFKNKPPRGKFVSKKDVTTLKLPPSSNVIGISKNDSENLKPKILLNTAQLQNNEKRITENNESIEEIYEIEEGCNAYNNAGTTNDYQTPSALENKINYNFQIENSILKNIKIEEKLDRYFDIPIIKKQKNTNEKYNTNTKENKQNDAEGNEDEVEADTNISKNKIINEILKENYKKSLNDSSLNRPYSPPFISKFDNLPTYENKTNLCPFQKESKDDNDEIVSNSTGKNTLDDKYKQQKYLSDNPKEELVYDYVLECYYHPQTNIFYELEK